MKKMFTCLTVLSMTLSAVQPAVLSVFAADPPSVIAPAPDSSNADERLFGGYIKSDTAISIMAEASLSSNVIGKLEPNTQIDVYACEAKGWYMVVLDGQTGYIPADYVDMVEDDESERLFIGYISSETPVVLRKAADENSDEVMTLDPGVLLDVLSDETDGWYYVMLPVSKDCGYVKAECVGVSNKFPFGNPYFFGITNQKHTVSMMAEPDSNADVICQIPEGTALSVFDAEKDGWYIVYFGGVTGFIQASQITEQKDQSLKKQIKSAKGRWIAVTEADDESGIMQQPEMIEITEDGVCNIYNQDGYRAGTLQIYAASEGNGFSAVIWSLKEIDGSITLCEYPISFDGKNLVQPVDIPQKYIRMDYMTAIDHICGIWDERDDNGVKLGRLTVGGDYTFTYNNINGRVLVTPEAHPDGTYSYWYAFYQEDRTLWNTFPVWCDKDGTPLGDVYEIASGQDGARVFWRMFDGEYTMLGEIYSANNAKVNVYASADETSAIINTVENRMVMPIFGSSEDGWYLLMIDEENAVCGYVREEAVRCAGWEIQRGEMLFEGENCLDERVDMLREPDDNADVVYPLDPGAIVDVYSCAQDGWYVVNYDGGYGYVRTDAIRKHMDLNDTGFYSIPDDMDVNLDAKDLEGGWLCDNALLTFYDCGGCTGKFKMSSEEGVFAEGTVEIQFAPMLSSNLEEQFAYYYVLYVGDTAYLVFNAAEGVKPEVLTQAEGDAVFFPALNAEDLAGKWVVIENMKATDTYMEIKKDGTFVFNGNKSGKIELHYIGGTACVSFVLDDGNALCGYEGIQTNVVNDLIDGQDCLYTFHRVDATSESYGYTAFDGDVLGMSVKDLEGKWVAAYYGEEDAREVVIFSDCTDFIGKYTREFSIYGDVVVNTGTVKLEMDECDAYYNIYSDAGVLLESYIAGITYPKNEMVRADWEYKELIRAEKAVPDVAAIAGKWAQDVPEGNASLTVNADGSFTLVNGKETVSGTVKVESERTAEGETAYYFSFYQGEKLLCRDFADLYYVFVTVPGAEEIRFARVEEQTLSGDINGDGAVNLKDVVMLRRHIAGGWNTTLDASAADINGDGTVNLKDVVMLRRMIAGGWESK